MALCKGGCGRDVTSEDVARYDVLAPDYDPKNPKDAGPWCDECWPSTATGRATAEAAARPRPNVGGF
ncbi:hypothetical protein QDA03_gp17 [Microbacterium phage Terij]|uniref:Uncharacterized protein n=1 Tax=Microbacterium phage Terij TaxID=2686229 RepID=A0A6B9LHD4_9CAUD|nr:hypothetical protein QDA03_gp17 [Microbacterium phage Terij]QHB37224.1 hypothetical protein SEA_TERIJ_90 [Microbacterium phage Terij]